MRVLPPVREPRRVPVQVDREVEQRAPNNLREAVCVPACVTGGIGGCLTENVYRNMRTVSRIKIVWLRHKFLLAHLRSIRSDW